MLLGHAVLHSRLNILFLESNTYCITNKFENEANKFAAELLISDNVLQDYPDYFTIEQIAAVANVHEELLKLNFNLSIF